MITTIPFVRAFISSDSTLDPRPLIVESCLKIGHEKLLKEEEVPVLLKKLVESNISAIPIPNLSVEKIQAFDIFKFFGLDLLHSNFSLLELELETGTIALSIHQYKHLRGSTEPELDFSLNLISYLLLLPTLDASCISVDYIDHIETLCSDESGTIPDIFRNSELIESDIQGELKSALTSIVRSWSISNTIRFFKKFPNLTSAQKTSFYRRMDSIQSTLLKKQTMNLEDLVQAVFPSYLTRTEELFGFRFGPLEEFRMMHEEVRSSSALSLPGKAKFRALSFNSINNTPQLSPKFFTDTTSDQTLESGLFEEVFF